MQQDQSKYDSDRPNSVLTVSHRDRLINTEADSSGDLTSKTRQRIRERTLSGTKDLGILYEYLDDRDIEQTFESYSMEEIIDAMRFFLRVCGTLDEPIEEPLEEAIFEMVSEKHPQKVVSNVSVKIETADREKAARRGKEKINQRGRVSLSPIEIQALAETDYRQLLPLTVPQSQEEFETLILDNLAVIDDTLELIDHPPRESKMNNIPDAVAKNERDQLVLIEVRRDLSKVSTERERARLERLVKEYGGAENAQGILFTLDNSGEQQYMINISRYPRSNGQLSSIPLDEFLDEANQI